LFSGADDNGWTLFDVFVMSANLSRSTYVFPKTTVDSSGKQTGWDAILCVHRVEPWVVEVFNSTDASLALRIVAKAESVDRINQGGKRRKAVGDGVLRTFDSKTAMKTSAFWAAYVQSTRTWFKVRYLLICTLGSFDSQMINIGFRDQ
jgi:hypothetical protein